MSSNFSHFATLKDGIAGKDARVLTVGLGYVGLPMALTVHEVGFDTTGLDINAERVARINAGEQVISYFAENRIDDAVKSGKFRATSEASAIAGADIILICVPTPLTAAREPDMRYVISAAETIADWLRPGQLVVLESTVWPGATANVLQPILERGGLRAGSDFFLGFSPEREDPGNASHTTRTIPKVVGADDKQSRDLLEMFYSTIVTQAVPVSSSATAEAVKLAENSFRTVNIALVNEMKVAMDAMGVDVWEVVKAAATKPFGYMPFYPGPGIGGDCIPVSPVYLSWRARDVGSETPIIDLARFNNEGAPEALATRIRTDLSRRDGVDVNGARILILGIAYKKDVEDTRESPALALLKKLEQMGADVDYHDPFFPVMPLTRDHPDLANRLSVPLDAGTLEGYDAVIVTTDHTAVDYGLVAAASKRVFDTRNAFDGRGIAIDRARLIKI
ncbi:MAG: UDP-N-acetyl-D-glucosamine dehydrogenase [Confluentimicrobium sp.]|jgi:UDP-N-acetyl-D-glucosamine dehydrogenase|uniref:nucleotide sugar dehydrogenase n=1 Tax=Actibacterium sp. TaxID=1872125 RepID=UPI000C3E0FCE|nr:nucleotide sugar dehydrogenase [Actibacterium sp.]MBC58413.1 UDP-N-acetyl-D-glucosamine dehydrogenase [Actibacterium sp.]MDY6858931.1 nucleotide sugar dehydrogenase [Pseudomonadota bacterium]|tara:strand:+ start:372 stop:1721 length:1350 start_codon:yes stop_codon:yes gene_type:complete